MFNCAEIGSVALDRAKVGFEFLDELRLMTSEAGKFPVALTVPALMTATSPEAGANCGAQLSLFENAPSEPFQVFVTIVAHSPKRSVNGPLSWQFNPK
jgi:hypothetical protein